MRHIRITYYGWESDAPRFVRRFYWRMIPLLLPLVVALCSVNLWNLGSTDPFGPWPIPPGLVVVLVLAFLWASAMNLWEKRLVKRLRAADYKLCPHCGYVLSGHEGAFDCPECGIACDLDKIHAVWRSFRPIIYRR